MSLFLQFCITAYKNIQSQPFPETCTTQQNVTIYSDKPELKKAEENIRTMINYIDKMNLFPANPPSDRGLFLDKKQHLNRHMTY